MVDMQRLRAIDLHRLRDPRFIKAAVVATSVVAISLGVGLTIASTRDKTTGSTSTKAPGKEVSGGGEGEVLADSNYLLATGEVPDVPMNETAKEIRSTDSAYSDYSRSYSEYGVGSKSSKCYRYSGPSAKGGKSSGGSDKSGKARRLGRSLADGSSGKSGKSEGGEHPAGDEWIWGSPPGSSGKSGKSETSLFHSEADWDNKVWWSGGPSGKSWKSEWNSGKSGKSDGGGPHPEDDWEPSWDEPGDWWGAEPGGMWYYDEDCEEWSGKATTASTGSNGSWTIPSEPEWKAPTPEPVPASKEPEWSTPETPDYGSPPSSKSNKSSKGVYYTSKSSKGSKGSKSSKSSKSSKFSSVPPPDNKDWSSPWSPPTMDLWESPATGWPTDSWATAWTPSDKKMWQPISSPMWRASKSP